MQSKDSGCSEDRNISPLARQALDSLQMHPAGVNLKIRFGNSIKVNLEECSPP